MPAPCTICGLDFASRRQVDAALMSGMTIKAVSVKFGYGHPLSEASLTRHRLGHLNRAIREVRIDDERTAADVLVGLVDTLVDVEKIRADAMQKGRSAAALKACAESRAIAKILFTDLGLDSTAVAMNLRDSQSLTRGLMRWIRKTPMVAKVLAGHLDGVDDRMASEFRDLYELAREADQTAA